MPYHDSVDKIVETYFKCMATEPFHYKGITYNPKKLTISPLLFRSLICPANCGACCSLVVSLDWLPSETPPYEVVKRMVKINDYEVDIYSDWQKENTGKSCKNRKSIINDDGEVEKGRCGIHTMHPFSCDFEIVRFLCTSEDRPNTLMTRFYGRGWNMMKVDGTRGAMCGLDDDFEDSRQSVLRKLFRLDEWMTHFRIKNRLSEVTSWIYGLNERPGNAVIFD